MFRHLFRLIWNRKKQHFLLIMEILISFLVMFAVCTLLVYDYQNYKKPMGMAYENVWMVSYSNPLKTENKDSVTLFYETLRRTLKSVPEVKELSFSSQNVPLSSNTSQTGMSNKGKKIQHINMYQVEDAYAAVLQIHLLEGRWFEKQDALSKIKLIVINNSFKQMLFGNDYATGKLVSDYDGKATMKVIGVVEDVKVKGDYAESGLAVYNRVDSGAYNLGRILISVQPGTDAAAEGRLYKAISNYMKTANIEIEHLTNMRQAVNNLSLIPMIVLLIVAGFLVINVALGLFGVLWYNINKRRGEIGLRRAIGASGKSVSAQLIAESMILATLSLLIGIFFAVQFPLMNVFNLPAGIYIVAILIAVIFIYFLVLICSFYPGRQAAAIYPAVALHED